MPSLRRARVSRPFSAEALEVRVVMDVAPPLPPPEPPGPDPRVEVPPPGQPPLAVDDRLSYNIATPASPVNVLANDLDGNPGATWDNSTLTMVAPPKYGSLTLDPISGIFLYTPNYMLPPGLPPGAPPPETPQDEFTYMVKNSLGMQSNVATAVVSPVGNPKIGDVVPSPDFGITSGSEPITIDVLANDEIFDGSQFVYSETRVTFYPDFPEVYFGPVNGTADFDPLTGKMTYTPNFGYIGWDIFSYQVKTTSGAGNTENITVIINPGAPRLVDDPLGGGKMLVVEGTNAADTIDIIPGNRRGEVRAIVNGIASPAFRPDTRVLVFGYAGNDAITVSPHVRTTAWLVGGYGDDAIRAGGASSLLLGFEGKDTLIGGLGRDVLIGGLGEDQLVGKKRGDQLVGGTTVIDNNPIELQRALNGWAGWSRWSWCDWSSQSSGRITDSMVFEDEASDTLILRPFRDQPVLIGLEDEIIVRKRRHRHC